MIQLTRLSHTPFVLNSDLIELIETTPDTVISLTTGQKLVVCETPDDIIHRIRDYKQSIQQQPVRTVSSAAAEGGVNGGF